MQAAPAANSPSEAPRRLGEAVFTPVAGAVPWQTQNANEARTTRTLDAPVPGDVVPVPDAADGAPAPACPPTPTRGGCGLGGSVSSSPLQLAVVGHTNTGKTSLLQTLLRRRDFGEVHDSGGTTQEVKPGEVADDDGVIAVLRDTPGIEDPEKLCARIKLDRIDHREDLRTRLDRFLATPAAPGEEHLTLAAKSVRAALDAHVLLYVIDARGEPMHKHGVELAVLAATARPLIPVLNYTAHPAARPNPWRNVCARHGVHTTLEFDAVVYDDAGEQRLLNALTALDTVKAFVPELDAVIERWKRLRQRERRNSISDAAGVAAEFLVTAAAAVVVTEPTKRNKTEREAAVKKATAKFLDALLEREKDTRIGIAAAFGFQGTAARVVECDVDRALGGVGFLSRANLLQYVNMAAAATAGAAAGAGAGAMADISAGGLSMGTGAVVGGTAGAVLAGGRKALRRLRGQEELRLRDDAVELLAARAVATIRAMLALGHAAVETDSIELAVKESLASDASPAWRASWRKARGKAAWSYLSQPPPKGVAGLARTETVKKVATALKDGL